MKHLLIILITLSTFSAFSQSSTPRIGQGVFKDNTFRALTFKYMPVVDTVPNDTIVLNPNAYKTVVNLQTVSASATFVLPGNNGCYLGDELTILASGTGTSSLAFTGAVINSALGSSFGFGSRAIITFLFDGKDWVEQSRSTY